MINKHYGSNTKNVFELKKKKLEHPYPQQTYSANYKLGVADT